MRARFSQFACLLLAGCTSAALPDAGGDDDAGNTVDPTLYNVNVALDYHGTRQGKIGVGAFTHDPPDGAPLSYVRVGAVPFPVQVTLRGLEAGQFYVFGVLDVPPDDPTIPGPTDLTIASPLLTLTTMDLDVSLILLDGSDGGTVDAGVADAGDGGP